MDLEEEGTSNPIESLEEGVERRFVFGVDDHKQVVSSLIVAREGRFNIPLKVNFPVLIEELEERQSTRRGFCVRNGDILELVKEPAANMPLVDEEQFQQALANGVKIVEPKEI